MSDPADIQQLANRLATEWPQITSAPQLIMHRENSVFRVETLIGPHALRLHRLGYHTVQEIKSELDWMAMLAAHGMEVPVPAAARDGNFVVQAGGRMASLLSWLPGVPLGKSGQPLSLSGVERATRFRSLGRAMAQMHSLLDAWRIPEGFTRPNWDASGFIGETPLWGRFWELQTASSEDREMLSSVRARAERALKIYAPVADFGLVHADLVRENILVDGECLRFIDFDDCGFGFRMFDVATALLKNIDELDFEELRSALLAGYQAIRPLAPVDLTALPVFMVLRALTYLGWAHARMLEPGMPARAERSLAVAKRMIATYPF